MALTQLDKDQPLDRGRGGPAEADTALWHSQAQMSVIKRNERVISRGRGAYVWDEQGNRLLDAPASLWYCNVGHGRAELADVAARQMRELAAYHTFQQFATRPALELAERVASLAPIKRAKVFFGSGGSDMIDFAAKLARRTWQLRGRKDKLTIVTRENAYHGLHGFGTSIAGLEPNRHGYGPLVEDTVRIPRDDAEALAELVRVRGADTVAAFICEPVMGTGGVFFPVSGYLERVEEICRQNDIVFIVDEVITGFGRVGEMFASQRFGISADILLTAKGITSGYAPLGAAIVSEPLWAPFWEDGGGIIFHHGMTYSGHATACAVAMANIDILESEHLIAQVRSLESTLAAALQPLAAHPLVKEVRTGTGLLGAVELHDPEDSAKVAAYCLEHGVIIRTITDGALQISPPFVIEEDDIAFLAEVLAAGLNAYASGARG
jgi:putrescine---pyruvate transaminase